MLAAELRQPGADQEKFKTTIDASKSQKVMTGVSTALQIPQTITGKTSRTSPTKLIDNKTIGCGIATHWLKLITLVIFN